MNPIHATIELRAKLHKAVKSRYDNRPSMKPENIGIFVNKLIK